MNNPFLFYAYLAGIFSSIAGGIVGSYVVVKRIVFIAGSIAHSVLGGMGLFLYINRTCNLPWLLPIYGAILFAFLSAYLIGYVHLTVKGREDTVIGAIWASGMAIGVIFLSLTPGYNVEVINFLFGNILWTSSKDLYTLLTLDGIVIIISLLFHKRFLAICFDETQARIQGIKTKAIYFLLLSLIAMTVVLLVQVVGAILVIALLSLPPAVANTLTSRLSRMILLAISFSLIFSALGIFAASLLNWPPGATISLVCSLGYLLTWMQRKKSYA